jgi:NADH-ubiquinone oxidoreductase chain 5
MLFSWGVFFLVLHTVLMFSFYLSVQGFGFMFDFCILSLGSIDVCFSFLFDYVSLGFFSIVCLISRMVFFYSTFYMEGSVDMPRFVYLVVAFVFSMGFLVFSGNFFTVMIGWDGLGLVSFCLVIYYHSSSSLTSGLITVYSNRVGDAAFLVAFFYFFDLGVFQADAFSFGFFSVIAFFVVFGAITKSAQIPFSAWLPAAMAAPTPVSSLVHSSTLVTAGVYVLVRFNVFFLSFSLGLAVFSLFTMFLAGFCACFEGDFKKIIAISTLSQLGFIIFRMSFGL